ncbi:hypothetical protein FRB99_006993 [Tulasnella sp. 403]|nr:hypothetical protein FRB99_006993 [Tulasnella sp. 403]
MPAPPVHYRLSLGDYGRSPSFIVQNSDGINWHNVPQALQSLLSKLSTKSLLDFSLGSAGRWYIKYLSEGAEKQELSYGLWETIKQNPAHTIDRLSLGSNGAFWGVMRIPDEGLKEFSYSAPTLRGLFETAGYYECQSLFQDSSKHIALGHNGAFAVQQRNGMRVNGVRRNLIAAIERAESRTTVKSVFLSTYDPEDWLIVLGDGTVDYSLPQSILDRVLPYCKLQFSLCKPQFPLGWVMNYLVSVWTSRALRESDSTTVQQGCDPAEYLRVRKLFHDSWKHPHKLPLPCIHGVYSVTPSHNLLSRYLKYRADDYTLNARYSAKKVMFIAKVITGNSHKVWRTDQSITAPPYLHDSVAGEVGVDLNYDEQVVYRDDAIIPAYLIVYSDLDDDSDW